MENIKQDLKKIYEIKFQYTTYNKLYVCLDDVTKVESKLKELDLNLSFQLDDESFSLDINRDLILVHETNQLNLDDLSSSTRQDYFNSPDKQLKELVRKNLPTRN
jgi:hypothetical protein